MTKSPLVIDAEMRMAEKTSGAVGSWLPVPSAERV
jgi:hypothetical protein